MAAYCAKKHGPVEASTSCFICDSERIERATAEIVRLRAESEGRRIALDIKAEQVRQEWARAEKAEAELKEALDALAPFATAYRERMDRIPDGGRFAFGSENGVDYGVTPADLKRAATTLARLRPPTESEGGKP